jgi:hypothetical protein
MLNLREEEYAEMEALQRNEVLVVSIKRRSRGVLLRGRFRRSSRS